MFVVHSELRAGTRLPALSVEGSQVRLAEWAVWLSMGLLAAIAAVVPDMGLKIPGHAILRSVFPMSLGLALAPRHLGGAVMGASGLATGLILQVTTAADIGFGALTSLALTGPMLDAVLWRVRSGWRLYVGIVLAGVSSNAVAFLVKLTEKLMLGGGKRNFASWLANSLWSYPLCGLLAGLISAAVWFKWRSTTRTEVPR